MKTTRALIYLGFRQTRKGAVILALLIAFMVGVQGTAYVASYTDQSSRDAFAKTLESAPALGILYGEPQHINTPSGYMVYRSVPFMTLIASIWALMATTKLLRGQEEDGRTEILLAASTTAGKTTASLLVGFFLSLLCSFIISTVLLWAVGQVPNVDFTFKNAWLSAAAIFLPALLFGALGAVVSQLSIARRRALYYGFFFIVASFALRAIGNTVSDLHWLKKLTPLGWSDLLSPAFASHPLWLIPPLIVTAILIPIALVLVARRDYGEGILQESTTVRPRYFLLGSYNRLAIRQNFPIFLSWGAIAMFVSGLIAAISSVATQALRDSQSLNTAVNRLGQAADLQVAFIGSGLVFTTLVFMIMVSVAISTIRSVEAKQYLDNLLVQPIRRTNWLAGRAAIIVAATILISILGGVITWSVAQHIGVSLELGNFLLVSIALSGTAIFLTGLGLLLYGLAPRFAAIGMYIVILWSFTVDLVSSVVDINDLLLKSSLFHYISASPTNPPDWKTFIWLVSLGAIMGLIGCITFTKRDIVNE